MKAIRIALLGLLLAAGLVSGADAHGPRVTISLGYPVYAAPPPVYYTPPPPVYYAPPPRVYYRPAPPLVYAPPYGYAGYSYDYDYGRRGGPYNHRHHHH